MPAGNPLLAATDKTPRSGVNVKLPEAFHNDIDPQITIKRENYRHRTMISLAEEGHTIKEIATIMEVSPINVSNVLRQPWARERMQFGIKQTLEQSLREMRDKVVKQSLENVVAIANNESGKIKVETQLAANVKLLDRFLGTPTQHIQQVISGDPSQLTDEQLARLAAEALEPQTN